MTIFKEEGPKAYYQGLTYGILRQLSFASIRIGLFDYTMQQVKKYKKTNDINLLERISVAVFTGAAAICVANPVDALKVWF